jgi:hypothetical protein
VTILPRRFGGTEHVGSRLPENRQAGFMNEDANINPIWDALMGENTDVAVIRTVVAVLLFAIVGGVLAWLAG